MQLSSAQLSSKLCTALNIVGVFHGHLIAYAGQQQLATLNAGICCVAEHVPESQSCVGDELSRLMDICTCMLLASMLQPGIWHPRMQRTADRLHLINS